MNLKLSLRQAANTSCTSQRSCDHSMVSATAAARVTARVTARQALATAAMATNCRTALQVPLARTCPTPMTPTATGAHLS
jgi:hypothetical protein